MLWGKREEQTRTTNQNLCDPKAKWFRWVFIGSKAILWRKKNWTTVCLKPDESHNFVAPHVVHWDEVLYHKIKHIQKIQIHIRKINSIPEAITTSFHVKVDGKGGSNCQQQCRPQPLPFLPLVFLLSLLSSFSACSQECAVWRSFVFTTYLGYSYL